MDAQNEFVNWATSPGRTLEEAFCAERLVEEGLQTWNLRHGTPGSWSWEARRERSKRRRLNPAHRVRISETDARQGLAGLLEADRLDFSAWDDRPVRNLSGLRFFSHFKNLSLQQNEITDLTPLQGLTQLEHLSVRDEALEDLTPIGSLGSLRYLRIGVRLPWPNVAALAALENLEEFYWAGNLLALEEIPRLARVRKAEFSGGHRADLPPRDCTRLPDMPWLEVLKLDQAYRLDGITRWPRLRNLTVGGPYRDLHPLTGLRQLTHLQLEGDATRDLSPLVQLTQLRRLMVKGSHPQDYSVLAEAPRLHEVAADGCKINRMELATLHAVLPKWDEEFEADTPRIPSPLQFKAVPHQALPAEPRAGLGEEAAWGGDTDMVASECRWMQRKLGAVLARMLDKGWGEVPAWGGNAGHVSVRLFSMDAAERLADVVDKTRAVLATGRWPWQAHLTVALDESPEEEKAEVELSEEEEIRQELEDHRDFKRRREEEQVILEREHQLRLLQQEGQAVSPVAFQVAENPPAPAVDDGDEEEEDWEHDSGGDTAHPLAGELFVSGVITAEGLWVLDKCQRAAEHLMRRKVDG